MCALPLGCSAALKFDQCAVDSDCAHLVSDSSSTYCSASHVCTSDVPADRLCKLDPKSSTSSSAVTIGGLFRLNGGDGAKDTDVADAATLAITEINQVSPRKLRFVRCDTGGTATQARRALTRAVEEFGAVAFVGPSSSGETIGLVNDVNGGENLLARYDVIVVSDSATSPSITSLSDVRPGATFGLVWRTCASDLLQGSVLASLVDTTSTKVGSAYLAGAYGGGLSNAFGAALGAQSKVTPTAKSFPEGTGGSALVDFFKADPPQFALVVSDADAPNWLTALGAGGTTLSKTQYLFTDGAKSEALRMASDALPTEFLLRLRGTAPTNPPTTAGTNFINNYKGEYAPRDPTNVAFTSNTYDAVYAIAIAMGAIIPGSVITGSFIADGMSRLSSASDPSLHINVGQNGFLAAYTALAMRQTVNLEGASGPIDFDSATGDVLTAPLEIWDIDTTVTPHEFGRVKIVTP